MKNLDPLALIFFGAALALLAGLLLYVLVFKAPESATPARAFDIVGVVRRQIDGIAGRLQDKPPVARSKAPPPAAKPLPPAPVAKSSPPAAKAVTDASLEAGRSWRYAVVVEPPTWRDITLTYRTQREPAGIGVLTDFIYAGGKMNFHLGTYAAGHPSHANTRFPGFFMYASYFPPALEKGQRLQWQWPWQPVREGRIKRYDGQVIRWENIQVPAGTYRAAVIGANLEYVEGGSVQARVRETIWYAPAVSQIVKVIREGKSPDESSSRIVAELVEYR
ncbi:MAG: hypothetical protein ABI654_08060 [Betaproteobacteria bacterium]